MTLPWETEPGRVERARRLHLVQYPLLRAFGFSLLLALAALHQRFLQVDAPAAGWWAVAGLAAAWCLATWAWLHRAFGSRAERDLQWLPLNGDVAFYLAVVYITGSEASWLFPVLISHVADQTNTTFRRTLWFAHLGTLAYVALLAWRSAVEGAALAWPGELTKVALLYSFGVYWSLTARAAEELRRRTREAVRVSYGLIEELRQRTEELDEARRRAEHASEAKSAFLATMTHELRTPLHAILGFSQLLRESDPPLEAEESDRFLRHIHSSGSHLLALINDVLDLVKVEQGKVAAAREAVDLPGLLEEVRQGLDALAREKELELTLETRDVPARVCTDPRRLRQILLNLLGNAVDFTPPGGRVALVAEAREGGLRFAVSDTGVGIPPEFHERVFEDFFQVGRTPGRAQKGTGLGLALTRRLVHLLGGTISLDSAPGRGSTFTVLLPLEVDDPPAAPAAPSAIPELPSCSRPILVVEDNALNMEFLETVLQRCGYRVVRAEDGRKGLLAARRENPALILMDLQLPDLDGLTVTRQLKADPRTRDIPVVAVTARGMREDEREAREAGCDGFLTKPLDRDDLLRVLAEHLEG